MRMLYFVIGMVCFLASAVGAVCGIGGGVIIKPVLDATGIMSVTTISFLSGCTVLSMSVISVYKSRKAKRSFVFDRMRATVLATGSVVGGLAGKELFQRVLNALPDRSQVGAVQALVLTAVTAGTLAYTVFKGKIRSRHLKNKMMIWGIGAALGIMSSFLGIGGGPVNVVALLYCFSMEEKEAAAYSVYIIMFSQLAALLSTLAGGNVPPFEPAVLGIMIASGILGGLAGSGINKKADNETVGRLFMGVMGVMICITIYNFFRYI